MSNPLFDLSGQVALVTGASRGLGQYFARALARSGADLVITSRTADSLQPFADEIAGLGRRAVPLALDVCDLKSIEQMAAAAEEAYGKIDILVNNAGMNIRKPALDVAWDDWNKILDTNLRGSFFVAQAIAKRMVPRRYGRIINIGSVTSVAGYAGLGPYGASRGGIRQLTMSLADDWGKNHSEKRVVLTQRLGVIPQRPHSHKAPRPARRSRFSRGISGGRIQPLHYRSNAFGRRRNFDRRRARAAYQDLGFKPT
jgi:NAD(P)-dependent dehydrogenase (short-subunit alcohol dehydrogenase family)